jgi:hypothetical protein
MLEQPVILLEINTTQEHPADLFEINMQQVHPVVLMNQKENRSTVPILPFQLD